MKTYYLIVFFFFLSAYTYSQNIYYGYPENTDALKKGDIIILNIPEHINGRYNKSKELDRLINFLCLNKHNIYKIEINLFWGTAELNVNYTKSLCNNLKELLDEKSIKNYKIKLGLMDIFNGKIFCIPCYYYFYIKRKVMNKKNAFTVKRNLFKNMEL